MQDTEHIETIYVPPLNASAVAYALVNGDTAVELTIKDAMRLQKEGTPYESPRPLRKSTDFKTFYANY